jgi:hypothetical protein
MDSWSDFAVTTSIVQTAPTMREIVIDTETIGFDPLSGDRIVEIGAVRLSLALDRNLQIEQSASTRLEDDNARPAHR